MPLTTFKLLCRGLVYFRWANLAVIAGVAVATAVLTGALMVGDSVRGSLRELAKARLGKVDHALVSMQFFPEALAQRVGDSTGADVAPAIILRGGASSEDSSSKTAGVQIGAIGGWMEIERGQAVLNSQTAEALRAKISDTVLLRLPVASDAPRDAALAKRGQDEVLTSIRAAVKQIELNGFSALFSLEASQREPLNAWVGLAELQSAVDQKGKVNILLAAGPDRDDATKLNETLAQIVTLDDYGLTLTESADGTERVFNASSTFIHPHVAEKAHAVAAEMGIKVRGVSVYLIDRVTPTKSAAKPIHYAIAAGIELSAPLQDDQIAINQWTANQMNIGVGDEIRLSYYARGDDGLLHRRDAPGPPMKVVRILPMAGIGADRSLTPKYKGLTEAEHFSDWDPPEGMIIDNSLADEPYWDQYRAAPKLFVSPATAARLWGGVWGDYTSLRIPADRAEEFAKKLRDAIDPAAMGLVFRPIRAQHLAAASGSTDFSGLFVGFSFFLIVAAALLVAMLFRLNVEQRSRQLGLMLAVGFAPQRVRRIALLEGMLLASIGGVIGVGGAVAYTAAMIAGLRTWWVDAVGTTALRLHVAPQTLAIGFAASVFIALLAILWAVWDLGRADAARLLVGATADVPSHRRKSRIVVRLLMIASLVSGAALIVAGIFQAISQKNAFLAGGLLLLIGGLAGAAASLRSHRRTITASRFSITSLAMRNASRHVGRSVLSIGLIAFAAFTLVTVASMREGSARDIEQKNSGAGGYQLIVQADIPLLADPSTPRGRDLLGIDPFDAPLWQHVRFMPMRRWQGEDASCLNLTRPGSPTILAASPSFMERNAFAFASPKDVENPWTLLNRPIGADGAIPVIADAETAQYILKLAIGDTLTVTDSQGVARPLRLVATLDHSIFQSELIMSEANFLKLFPAQAGYGVVLVEAPADQAREIQRILATGLAEQAAMVETTSARLSRYAQVKNTYLSTFQTLGSLGLMLGTIGLAVVLARNLSERRSELALLSAIGFSPLKRAGIVLTENAYLLVLGLGIGCATSLIAVAPAVFAAERTVNLAALLLTMSAVLAIGLVALTIAVWLGQRTIRPADLRVE